MKDELLADIEELLALCRDMKPTPADRAVCDAFFAAPREDAGPLTVEKLRELAERLRSLENQGE